VIHLRSVGGRKKHEHGTLELKEERTMDQYIKGEVIKALREKKKMTQAP